MSNLRYAFRQFAKAPGFAALAVLVLALGIAGNLLVFSFVNGLFLRQLPFPHPEQLVDLDETAPKWNLTYTGINYADFEAWREHNSTFSGMAHFRGTEFNLSAADRAGRVPGQRVTHDLADVLGIKPVLGRMFTADEELRGGPRVALLGHHIWKEWFNSATDIIGRNLTLDSETYEIIGVLPATAVLPTRSAVWVPFLSKPKQYGGMAIGRLKPGVTPQQAAADLLPIHRARIPEAKENEVTSPLVQPVLDRYVGSAKVIGGVLMGSVTILLLIACANVSGIMLARALDRSPELGIRVALGASRGHVVRQLVTESLVLAAAGAFVGFLLSQWTLDALLRRLPDIPAWVTFDSDFRTAFFVCGIIAVCAVFAGLVPAQHVLGRINVRDILGPASQQVTASASRVVLLRALVVIEIALAAVLLILAGYLGRAFVRLQDIKPGIEPTNVLTYGVLLPEAKYRSAAARIAFFQEHLTRVRAVPGVESASVSTVLPFSGEHVGNSLEPEGGLPGGPGSKTPVVLTRNSMPGYFETMGIVIRSGRSFTDKDVKDVVVVNETLARMFWPGQDAVGKRMRGLGAKNWLEVIGVAADVRHYGLETEVRPGVYVPFLAMPASSAGVVIRTKGDPTLIGPTIRSLLRDQDPTLPVAGLATMESRIRDSLSIRRLYSGMTAGFALIAVAMSMTGLYGVIAYVVGRRTREFGIRIALGAQTRNLLWSVLGQGARLAAIGTGLGLAGGVLAGVAASKLTLGVSVFDPVVLSGTAILLCLVIAVACWIPALRATRVNPVEALRAE